MSHKVKERAIHALVDGRLSEAKAVDLEAHLVQCHQCSRYYDVVLAGQAALSDLGQEPLPPVDWSRIDAALEAQIEETEERATLRWPTLLGAFAATAAAVFLVTLWFATRSDPAPPQGGARQSVAQASGPTSDDVEEQAPAALGELAFVTFVAGRGQTSLDEGQSWQPMSLESELPGGVTLRTEASSAAGVQVGSGAGCRLAPSTEATLTADGTRFELERGRLVCTSSGERESSGPLVVAVVELVASASASTRFAVERLSDVIILDVVEGHVEVGGGQGAVELAGPMTIRFSVESGEPVSEATVMDEERRLALSRELGLLPRRSIASLSIPALDRLERVEVDGVDYGALPLSLRRRPGMARVLLYPVGGGAPIEHEVSVSLGPSRIEPSALLPTPVVAAAPRERHVRPRQGTLESAQKVRVSSLVRSHTRRCYERTLKRYPNVVGRIDVALTITTTGDARAVRVRSLSGGHPDVNACIEGALSSSSFPVPRGGSVSVAVPATLSPRF